MSFVWPEQHTYVAQGQLHVSDTPDRTLASILGSCVAACLRDPQLGIGGMNHFLLPGQDPRASDNLRYGHSSMQALVEALLDHGAERNRLEIWLFGGADVLDTKTGIGAANGLCALTFIHAQGITLRGSDLGGVRGRRVNFRPYSGEPEVTLARLSDGVTAPNGAGLQGL